VYRNASYRPASVMGFVGHIFTLAQMNCNKTVSFTVACGYKQWLNAKSTETNLGWRWSNDCSQVTSHNATRFV